jgi:uncharacterized protein YecA (UPF0149 family)
MIEIKRGWVITESEHVVQFMRYIMSLDVVFHPDDDMLSYIDLDTDEPTFSVEDAKYLNETIQKCFDICGYDVYDICMALIEEKEKPVKETKRHYGILGVAGMMIAAMPRVAQIDYTSYDKIALSRGTRTKRIDIYREYKPDPDAQPRNERCKCGSGKKFKHCCIKK